MFICKCFNNTNIGHLEIGDLWVNQHCEHNSTSQPFASSHRTLHTNVYICGFIPIGTINVLTANLSYLIDYYLSFLLVVSKVRKFLAYIMSYYASLSVRSNLPDLKHYFTINTYPLTTP